jgi:hypothetical protein
MGMDRGVYISIIMGKTLGVQTANNMGMDKRVYVAIIMGMTIGM